MTADAHNLPPSALAISFSVPPTTKEHALATTANGGSKAARDSSSSYLLLRTSKLGEADFLSNVPGFSTSEMGHLAPDPSVQKKME